MSEALTETSTVERTEASDIRTNYLETLNYVERMHRLLLDVIKDDLERVGIMEINSVQALLIFNIGDSELTAGELRTRGYYQGSNVSYNLKKLVEFGYIDHKRSDVDRRSVRVSLTPKGLNICKILDELYNKHIQMMGEQSLADAESLADLNTVFKDFERFWSEQIRYRY